jgi:hypothetical protein
MYPDTLHGLNALAFGVVGAAVPGRLEPLMEILLDLRGLRAARAGEEAFARLPLEELSVSGFELLFEKALDMGLEAEVLQSPAYAAYMEARAAAGLDAATA